MAFDKKTWENGRFNPKARLNAAAMNDLEDRIESGIAGLLPDYSEASEGDVLTIGSGGPEWAEPQGGGGVDATPWTPVEQTNDWVPHVNPDLYPAWRRVGDIVHLTGVVKHGQSGGGLGIGVMVAGNNFPEEIKPQFLQYGLAVAVSTGDGVSVGRIYTVKIDNAEIRIGAREGGADFITDDHYIALAGISYSLAPPAELPEEE